MGYQQKGFTLVELVLTLVILGALATVAVPRFADLGDAADQTTFESVRSNFRTGVAFVYSTSLINLPKSTSGFPDVLLEGNCIQVDSASGYPLVDQTSGTCNAITSTFPFEYNVQSLDQVLFAMFKGIALVPEAHAGGPPPPPPPPGTIELPQLLIGGEFEDWIWTKTAPTATFESPEGNSFTYNQDTGAVN